MEERPKKKKKKKKKGDAPETDESTALPGRGTPDGDKLRAAVRAFDIGDYALVRAKTDELAKSDEPEIRTAAAALRERIEIDPIQIAVVAACAVGFIVILYIWVL